MSADDIFAGSGQCLVGPHGTTLPADIDDMDTLAPALIDLGEINEDGLQHAFSVDKTTLKNWAGKVVRVFGTSSEITFKLTFLERGREVLELFYGAQLSAAGTGSRINLGQPSDADHAMVIPCEDPATGKLETYVLPRAVVSERGDRTVKPDESGFELTFTAQYDPVYDCCGWVLFDDDLTSA